MIEQIKVLGLVPGLPSPADSVKRKILIMWTEVQERATKKFSSWKECLFLTVTNEEYSKAPKRKLSIHI